MKENKTLTDFDINHIVQKRMEIPSDYHCSCEYCKNFLGEIYNNDNDKYYSNRVRSKYYLDGKDETGKHLDVGQIIGYRFAIQNFVPVNGWVLDPTVGSGTAIVESINNERNAIGIELEYPKITKKNIDLQYKNGIIENVFLFKEGNAINIDEYLNKWDIPLGSLDMIINGPPYPANNGKSSDSPERKNKFTKDKIDDTFDYNHIENIGLTRGKEWENLICTYFKKCIPFLKQNGVIVLLIKDLVRNGQPYLLHKEIVEIILKENNDIIPFGFFIHKHMPSTMFIHTYKKRFPDRIIPLYQTGIVLKKI